MSTQLQIDQMTVAEKLRIMEELWEDLRSRAEGVPMPQWHKDHWMSASGSSKLAKHSLTIGISAKKRITEQTS